MIDKLKNNFTQKISDLKTSLLSNQNNMIIKTKNYYHSLLYSIRNLVEVNINLGLYHLMHNNITDAILRFKLVNHVYSKDNQEAYYWLGVCYFVKGHYQKAEQYLTKTTKEDHLELLSFLSNMKDHNDIPSELYSFCRNIKTIDFIDNYYSYETQFNEYFHDIVQPYFNKSSNLNILDLGANLGILSQPIRNNITSIKKLTAVEESSDMLQAMQKIYANNPYDELLDLSCHDFLITENKEQYDIIFSCHAIGFTRNLQDIFTKIYDMLNNEGYLILFVHKAEKTIFSSKYLEFVYNMHDMQKILQEKQFSIVSHKQLDINNNNSYDCLICQKNNML